jgi:nicotinate phosphoribosyltransferase
MIKSLCDTDLYKLTMMQVVFEKYTSANVRYDFKCRSGNILENLGDNKFRFINEICTHIHELCKLNFSKWELEYLKDIRFFKPNFIEFLRTFQLNEDYIRINEENDDLSIIIEGPWISTILFEVPILSIVSETYHKYHDTTATALIIGQEKFKEKMEYLDKHIHRDSDLRINDLGTRRRFSYDHQQEILRNACHYKYIKGTSNIHFARTLGLTPVGTMAHEYICAHQQLGRVEDSQTAAFQAWADVYRGDLGIALSDTVGFNAFLRDFDLYFAKLFDGARHDSGDPYWWCETLIKHYEKLSIDPKSKIAVFSDGLTFQLIVDLFKAFNSLIKTSFGIGTNLTNDCGVDPLQIVMKLTECNGRPVAKIPDSEGKGMCRDAGFEKYIKGIFNV